nr:hypothetical protein [Tanacetum cinerariifolium]
EKDDLANPHALYTYIKLQTSLKQQDYGEMYCAILIVNSTVASAGHLLYLWQ